MDPIGLTLYQRSISTPPKATSHKGLSEETRDRVSAVSQLSLLSHTPSRKGESIACWLAAAALCAFALFQIGAALYAELQYPLD